MTPSELFATWLVAAGTLVLAVVAVFQDAIRGWFYQPRLQVSIRTAPPDCVKVALTNQYTGAPVADTIHLRLQVENVGRLTAKNVEVYARELRRQRVDGTWENVSSFPPMNLVWASIGGMYMLNLSPRMSKHCDLGHIVDPAQRSQVPGEESPNLELDNETTSLTFSVIAPPNHMGHIIGPGQYQLEILAGAENVPALRATLLILLHGAWHDDEATMLRDGVGVTIENG
ncbi:MAG: hypothetical protein FJ316_12295 [SAR202 cluster bacterium]|nr:hypothetical protein [SAR202 cluster bacterium]